MDRNGSSNGALRFVRRCIERPDNAAAIAQTIGKMQLNVEKERVCLQSCIQWIWPPKSGDTSVRRSGGSNGARITVSSKGELKVPGAETRSEALKKNKADSDQLLSTSIEIV